MNPLETQLKEIKSAEAKPPLLLHSCCAPCSSYVLEYLKPCFDITLFWFNPNIIPADEYRKRLSEQKRLLSLAHSEVRLIEGGYDRERWEHVAAAADTGGAYETERCYNCQRMRLEETAKVCKTNNHAYFTSTLSVSPHKNAAELRRISEDLAAEYGLKTLNADFKKKGGFARSVELSKRYNLYRQNYCGCRPPEQEQ